MSIQFKRKTLTVIAITSVIFISITQSSFAQIGNIKFKKIGIEDGLTDAAVQDIYRDKDGFVWFATLHGLNRFDGYNVKQFYHIQDDTTSLCCNSLLSIHPDHNENLWIGTNAGLDFYNRETNSFSHYRISRPTGNTLYNNISSIEIAQDKLYLGTGKSLELFDHVTGRFSTLWESELNFGVWSVLQDSKGVIWFGSLGDGLYYIDDSTDQPTKWIPFSGNMHFPFNEVWDIYESSDSSLWIATEKNGVIIIDPDRKNFKQLLHQSVNNNSLASNSIRKIIEQPTGIMWFGTFNGLNNYNVQTGKFKHYMNNQIDPFSLSSNIIYSLVGDYQDNIWVGTSKNVNYFSTFSKKFSHHYVSGGPNTVSNNYITTFEEDPFNNIWIGTGYGLNQLNLSTGVFTHHFKTKYKNSLVGNSIKALLCDDTEKLWIGTHHDGLSIYDIRKKTFQNFSFKEKDTTSLSQNFIKDIVQDSSGHIWIATWGGGLNFYVPENKSFKRFQHDISDNTSIPVDWLTDLYVDRNGLLWIGSGRDGLFSFDYNNKKFKIFSYKEDDPKTLSDNSINSIFQDSTGNFWIGTEFGLNLFHPDSGVIEKFFKKDGLPDDKICGITTDSQNNVWITTNNGLSKLAPQTDSFTNYDYSDGLQGNKFNSQAILQTSQGSIWVGGEDGMSSFFPDKIVKNPYPPEIQITGFRIKNNEIQIGPLDNGRTILNKSIEKTKEIKLLHADNIITFEFSALHFTAPENNRYAYKLVGFQDEWVNIGNERTATFTNLDPGEYTFCVKAANSDGVWTTHDAQIKLFVAPPAWLTWWAKIIYLFIFLMALYTAFRFIQFRERVKSELALDQIKMQFFTNISHEFRTPLTLILSPLEQLLNKPDLDKTVHKKFELMRRNTKQLLHLVNQLLDFQKISSNSMTLNATQSDIVSFVEQSCENFKNLAEHRDQKIVFHSNQPTCLINFDAEMVQKIINNLISNALKYSDKHTTVDVGCDILDEHVQISVSDSGIGIAPEHQDHIFDRFYQIKNNKQGDVGGTGIGLALTKDLVELHNGEIWVKSQENTGTTMYFKLPRFEKNENIPVQKNDEQIEKTVQLENKFEHSILIIDDNDDIRAYLSEEFGQEYTIFTAVNGYEGLKTATSKSPDLIISDIMMPKLDGIAMCDQLKSNMDTSHIPIILLTARSAPTIQLKGLEHGADDYVTKPFSIQLLRARVANLISTRQKLAKRFQQEILVKSTDLSTSKIDHEFMEKLEDIIHQNMSDPSFSVDILSKKIGISERQLYRKIKALTNLTVNDFIRTIRLKHAAHLLLKPDSRISETSWQVGFSDVSHFRSLFKKQFKQSPSEYIKTHQSQKA